MMRTETRRERMNKKLEAKVFPLEVCTINFQIEENVAFVMRSAVCFGASTVNVIGSIPEHKYLVQRGGTTQDCVVINQFSNIHQFLEYVKKEDIFLVTAELTETSVSIHDFKFPFDKRICIVLGHETMGVPEELLLYADALIQIPLPGKGFCLNTSVTGALFMYEVMRQYAEQHKEMQRMWEDFSTNQGILSNKD